MMARLLLTEWERAKEKFQFVELKSKKAGISQYAYPLNPPRHYPRFHLHVMKKNRVWIEIWVHLDWKRHTEFEIRNELLIDFMDQLQHVWNDM